MHNHRSVAIAALGFVLFTVVLASASITGGISGVVRDKSGAVISDASVVAIDTHAMEASRIRRTSVSPVIRARPLLLKTGASVHRIARRDET